MKHQFGFLFTLLTSSEAELSESACKFLAHYSTGINEVFEDELIHFVGYIKYDLHRSRFTSSWRRTREHKINIRSMYVNPRLVGVYLTFSIANTEREIVF